MTKEYFLSRGEDAFPHGCPACGDDLQRHDPPTDEEYEGWQFTCGCWLIFDGGFLEVHDDCGNATQEALNTWRNGDSK